MTQIKKTLSIAGIIALATAPAMAEIASTQYVQNALSGITGALDAKLSNNVTEGDASIAIGAGAYTESIYPSIAIGKGAGATGEGSVAIGAANSDSGLNGAVAWDMGSVAIGTGSYAGGGSSVAINGTVGDASVDSIAIGGTVVDYVFNAIQLGPGVNSSYNNFSVGLGDYDDNGGYKSYPLLVSGGTIPYERFAPEIPNTCKATNGQKCALVITWDSTNKKFTQDWEVVRSTSSGQ